MINYEVIGCSLTIEVNVDSAIRYSRDEENDFKSAVVFYGICIVFHGCCIVNSINYNCQFFTGKNIIYCWRSIRFYRIVPFLK